MSYAIDHDLAVAWLRAAAAAVEQRHQELTELDAAIGDGDHGTNLRRGFAAVTGLLDELDPAAPPGSVLTRAGTTLISKVGGASGPLYGSALRAAGTALPAPTADLTDLAQALRTGLTALQKLGGAAVGDKTMVDAFEPAVAALERAAFDGFTLREASALAAEAAEAGARATIPLEARKGRASYLGPRSIDHQDPGATSTALLFAALAEVSSPH
ncbi:MULTISPECIES: dihydroxyacetone kinase subunit DhaL [Kitasatospora]|jgi:dihydroxyacetone kinase-like protein|uniref:dihydroxyacetone kinase subunit DhaL n=1 Tax=Kitasatospora TaxID=2063 RepID=UPI000CBBD10A|nr:dihydroxyacetone kinase subunit DhaL [Kitasatospora sp. GP30]MDH6140909.1 dihydroxyacetone kinase-like protein [Kitasatospora sp. GP30]